MQATGNTLRPGLDVSVLALGHRGDGPSVRLTVRNATTPVRLHLYIDGELVESWVPAPSMFTFDLGALGGGRHAVTARAIDANGRWGGDSIVVG
jgi:hypothetical protein